MTVDWLNASIGRSLLSYVSVWPQYAVSEAHVVLYLMVIQGAHQPIG